MCRQASAAGARAGLEALPSEKAAVFYFFFHGSRTRFSGSNDHPPKEGIAATERTLSPLAPNALLCIGSLLF
jgi:hypothetical protein